MKFYPLETSIQFTVDMEHRISEILELLSPDKREAALAKLGHLMTVTSAMAQATPRGHDDIIADAIVYAGNAVVESGRK